MDDKEPDIDNSVWTFTSWIQSGRESWTDVGEKFWRVPSEIKDRRYTICKECEHFITMTTQCQQCFCAMGIKTWFGGFACPVGKWTEESRPGESEA